MYLEYLEDFSSVLKRCQITDSDGRALSLDEGSMRAIERLRRVSVENKKVIFVGNGGSAGIASHQAIDYWKNGGIRAITFNDSALLTCLSNDYSYEEVFSRALQMFAEPGDVLFAISSSGKSKNILNAADAARAKDADVVTFSGFKSDNPLRAKGLVNFYLPNDEYGLVEVGHLFLSHLLLDNYMAIHVSPSARLVRTESTPRPTV